MYLIIVIHIIIPRNLEHSVTFQTISIPTNHFNIYRWNLQVRSAELSGGAVSTPTESKSPGFDALMDAEVATLLNTEPGFPTLGRTIFFWRRGWERSHENDGKIQLLMGKRWKLTIFMGKIHYNFNGKITIFNGFNGTNHYF